jgi:hypothetical protein
VFGIGGRKNRAQLIRAELNQGIGHLRQAATHAARGAGATVGPRVRSARNAIAPTALIVRDRAYDGLASTIAALAPLAAAVRGETTEAAWRGAAAKQAASSRKARAKARNLRARKRKARGRSMMTGLFAAGAVAGLAGAMAMRRRRERQEWEEYDPIATMEPVRDEVDTMIVRTPSGGSSDPSGAATGAAGGSAVAGGDGASAGAPGGRSTVQPNDAVPSVAEGARDTSGRPADDLGKALGKQGPAKSSGRR